MAFELKKTGVVKALTVAICILSAALLICGCNGGYENVVIDVEKVASEINANAEFDDTLVKLSDDVVRVKYPSLIDSEKTVIYAGSGATAEEIIILELSDAKSANVCSEKLKTHNSEMRKTFTDYNSSELPKIDSAVNVVRGKYVIYCVSCDASKVGNIIDDFFE